MDLKALIAKMDHIESKKILNEGFPTVADAKARADKEKTTGKFDKKEIKPGVTQYTRKSSTFDDGGKDSDQKKAEKKKKNEGIEFQGSIAQELLREFGLLSEQPAAGAPAEAPAADPNAVKQIQAMLKANGQGVERLQNAIDPKTGIIYYGEEQGEGGQVSPKATPFNWIQKGQQKEFQDLVKAAGLSIVPVDQKTLFGTTKVAAVEPKGLANLGKAPTRSAAPATAPAAPATAPAAAPAAPAATAPAAAPAAPAAPAPATAPAAGGATTTGMDDGSKITTTPGGGAAATNSDGTPYIPGSNPNLPKNQTKTQGMDDGSQVTTGPAGSAATDSDGNPYVPGSNPNLPQNQKPAEPAAAAAPATAKPPAGGAGGDAAVEATRKRMKELMDKLEKTGGVSGAPAAPAAKPPVGGKPATAQPAGFANTGGGAAVGNPNIARQGAAAGAVRETSEDNYILSLIRAK